MARKKHIPVLDRTPEHIQAGNLWSAYVKGWAVGAKAGTPDAAMMQPLPEHARVDEIRTAYQAGYEDGCTDRGRAERRAARRYRYTISILCRAHGGA